MKVAKNTFKKIIKNRFYLSDELGTGGYGSVFKAIDKKTNKMVAIKFVILDY